MTRKAEPFVSLGWSAISWIEHYLVHGPGDVQGQPIELDDEFARFILNAYRLNPETGRRKVRRSFLSRAKGRSKSGLAAFIACFEALGPARFDHWAEPGEVSDWGYEYETGEPVGKPLIYVEALCVATEEGQAGNTYDGIHYMLNPETCSDELREDYPGLDVGLSRVILPKSRGTIEPLSSGDSSKDGGKSTFIVADETHLWILPRLKSMHATMARNMIKRKVATGWMLETSTMYGEGEGSVAEGTHAYANSAVPGSRAAETLLFDHQQASDKWNLEDRDERIAALHESYGPAAEWMDIDALADTWDDPQVTEAEFRRYWLNQPVPMVVTFTGAINPDKWTGLRLTIEQPDDIPAIGLGGSPDGLFGAIGAASVLEDGRVIVAPVGKGRQRGQRWLIGEAARIQKERGCAVVVASRGPLKYLIPDLIEAGVNVTQRDASEWVDACEVLWQHVKAGTLAHPGDKGLNDSALSASWKKTGDRRAFARDSMSPLIEATALAAHAAQTPNRSAYEDHDFMAV